MTGESVNQITADEAWELHSAGAILLDVRSSQEVAEGCLAEAAHHPHEQIIDGTVEIGCNPESPVVIFCKVGGRAQKVGEHLLLLGFKKVYNAGSFEELQASKKR